MSCIVQCSGASSPDYLVEKAHIVAHAPDVLERQRALRLQDDVVEMTILYRVTGDAGIRMPAQYVVTSGTDARMKQRIPAVAISPRP